MKKIKIGQIGIGHNHAHEIMRAFRMHPDIFEIAGVVEDNPDWREKRGKLPGYEGLKWLTREQLFNTDGLQAISVETDVCDLNKTALDCLKAGFHIHLDKPGPETLGDFKLMLDEAARKKLTVQMGYMFRNNPAIQFCIKAVKDGWLGRIFEIDAVMSRTVSQDYRNWISQFHGGAMYIFGCHLIDLVLAMLGCPDNIRPFQRRTRPEVDSLYDNGLAVLEYSHATAVVRTSVVEVEGFLRRQMTVCGDEGTIEIYPIEPFNQPGDCVPKLRMALSKPRGKYKAGYQDITFPAMQDRYADQLLEFAQIIRREKENPYSLEYELMLQKKLLTASDYPQQSLQ